MNENTGRAAILTRLRQHARTKVGHLDPLPLAFSVEDETDRGAVIVLGAIVEDALEDRIKDKFASLNSDQSARLFGPDGPIGTFSAKTKLAFALGIIDRDNVVACDIIRDMRNACAHSRTPLSFRDNVLMDAFKELMKIVIDDGDKAKEPPVERARFLFGLLVAFVSNSILHGTDIAAEKVDVAIATVTQQLLRRQSSRDKPLSQDQ